MSPRFTRRSAIYRLCCAVLVCVMISLLSSCSDLRTLEDIAAQEEALAVYLETNCAEYFLKDYRIDSDRENAALPFASAAILRTVRQRDGVLAFYISYYIGLCEPRGTDIREYDRIAGPAVVLARPEGDGLYILSIERCIDETYEAFTAKFAEESGVDVDFLMHETNFLAALKDRTRQKVREFYHLPVNGQIYSPGTPLV
ncbi:MAG: hypothetical protein HFJ80_03810 [Clostridiales bacterium]|nr:hypothetical protein [Clostridiales bacterium]